MASQKERELLKHQADKLALKEGSDPRNEGGVPLSMISALPSPRGSDRDISVSNKVKNIYKKKTILKKSSYRGESEGGITPTPLDKRRTMEAKRNSRSNSNPYSRTTDGKVKITKISGLDMIEESDEDESE